MNRIEKIGKCKSCRATGIYRGMGEGEGIGVQCHGCKGTGKVTHVLEWEEFEGRVVRDDLEHVLECNPGIGAGAGNGHELTDFGGMPYEQWLRGESFPAGSEMRAFTCPAWWYQSTDSNKKPNWKECGFGTFSSCKLFDTKQACWNRWDACWNRWDTEQP